MPLILEGVVSTQNEDGSPNISPMGPIVDRELTKFQFRPFHTSRTYQNLKRNGAGVFHVVDDVLLLAQAATHQFSNAPETTPAETIEGVRLLDACRWYEFEVTSIDDSSERTSIETRILHVGENRQVWGFNRAKHAVLELAVLSTRLFMIDGAEIAREVDRLATIVDKTAGDQEREAFDLLREYIANYDGASPQN
ncbi:MAG: DUF447 family protein [Planctomycetaceae bacterium]|jgi:uncharacterized protein|nr:DUF447 family protein [Planctomycetaceae bacterium]MDG2388961.1 DUF447 family protein [Planctomycetaceae bacterium]